MRGVENTVRMINETQKVNSISSTLYIGGCKSDIKQKIDIKQYFNGHLMVSINTILIII